MMKKGFKFLLVLLIFLFSLACEKDKQAKPKETTNRQWSRSDYNPVFRDSIPSENYEVASDAAVFFDSKGTLNMIYSGDYDGKSAIKLAVGTDWENWSKKSVLLSKPNVFGTDSFKETAFYRKTSQGKHQIYYIGYDNETTYKAQIFLAEADTLEGPYSSISQPVVPRGLLANKQVYCMTSPSVVEYQGLLYLVFIAWNNRPNEVSEIWIMGATSTDEGHSWDNFQLVDAKIGMEGQLTKTPIGDFVAVRTGNYNDKEAIFYSKSESPFGPWVENENPILIQNGPPYEKDEITAAQITFDPISKQQYLYYTGASHQKGWWIMLAKK